MFLHIHIHTHTLVVVHIPAKCSIVVPFFHFEFFLSILETHLLLRLIPFDSAKHLFRFSLCAFAELFSDYDPFLGQCPPSNPWLTSDTDRWDLMQPLYDDEDDEDSSALDPVLFHLGSRLQRNYVFAGGRSAVKSYWSIRPACENL